MTPLLVGYWFSSKFQNLQALRQERKLHDQRRVIAGALQVQLRRRAAACM